MDPGSSRTKVGLRQGLVVQLQVRGWQLPSVVSAVAGNVL